MNGDTKRPNKKTIYAICIGMKLSLDEAEELLASADYAFNPYVEREVSSRLYRGKTSPPVLQ
ncbi:MAG: hypothetical protein K6F53_06290 [Lachnospiraceae bacterium]|nr:hypothetical protein [Lachnospiraceae bacterium]